MHIVQVANFYSARSGGLRTTLEELGRGYVEAGHSRTLIVPGATAADEETPAGRRLTVAGIPVPGGYRLITDRRATGALVESLGPDCVEVSDKVTLGWLGPWARRRGVPAILLSHERIDAILAGRVPRWFPLSQAADHVNRRLAGQFDRVVCTSSFAAAEFERVGAANVVRVPLGVDLDVFRPPDRPAPGAGTRVVVCVGRLSAEKRPHLALAAFEHLVSEGVAARLVMIGDGPLASRLRRRFGHLPVEWRGHIADRSRVAGELAAADVALLPCPVESFGLAVLEAMACGTPVVVPRTGAAAEMVAPWAGVATYVTPRHLAGGVRTVLGWPEELPRAATRRQACRYPWSATVAGMLDVHASTRAARAA